MVNRMKSPTRYYVLNSMNGFEEAGEKRALLVSNVQVTDLITEGGGKKQRVVGVRCHDDEVYAKLVVIAEGSNTLLLLEKTGLTAPTDPSTMAVGVKRGI